MKTKLLSIFALCFTFTHAQAINVGPITSVITSDTNTITKEITNNADSSRLVALRISRLNTPTSDGIEIPFDQPDELLSSPANLILSSQGTDIFRLRYNGPSDEKERYYRLTWADLPVMEKSAVSNEDKTAIVNTRLSISTILVVSPRQSNISYEFKDGVLRNTGNTSFRITSAGGCDSFQDCGIDMYLMPGKERKIGYAVNNKAIIGIWVGDKFIPVKNETSKQD
jgi:hypothetical protein